MEVVIIIASAMTMLVCVTMCRNLNLRLVTKAKGL